MSAADIRPTCPKCHGTGRVAEVAPVGGLDEMFAAAEERGRRKGVEEMQALLCERAELLGEARAWIDKHKCCTEERRELVARIDEARK